MTKEKLIETIKKILSTDHDLSFLMKLTVSELETAVASIRDRAYGVTHNSSQT